MSKPLANKTALITGASRGIGKAIALYLASLGANIVINYARNEEAANAALRECEKLNVRAKIFQANVGDEKALGELADFAVREFGSIEILIHNAALGAFKPVHKLRANQWDLSIDVNAKALFLLVQKLLPVFEKQGSGCVVTLSSLGAQTFIPNYGAIGISKAALETLVRYLAVELASKNIRVNCVSGGLIETDAMKLYPDYTSLKKEVIARTPAGRIGTPEDLAKVIGFLTLPESAWITGQTIIADGGLSLI